MRGVGIDLVHVPSFEEQLARPGCWQAQVFTSGERRDCGASMASFAARWAAKEATIKAWSDSMWGEAPLLGESIHHLVEVVTDAWGRPRLRLHGDVAKYLADTETHVSLSHDGDYATAIVTLSSSRA